MKKPEPAERLLRVIVDEPLKGPYNMGIDSAIVKSAAEGESCATLRLYSWENPVVTVGYFQKIADTVNIDYCRKNYIDIIRRITGGGTVLHNKEITYSFIIPLKNSMVPSEIHDSFKKIIDPVIKTLNEVEIKAQFKPVNDIVVDSKKISGSAQTRKHGVLLQHGTIILETDIDLFENALLFDIKKLEDKKVSRPVELITSVKDILGYKPDSGLTGKIIKLLINNYRNTFEAEIIEEKLTNNEILVADNYRKEIFENKDWNLRR